MRVTQTKKLDRSILRDMVNPTLHVEHCKNSLTQDLVKHIDEQIPVESEETEEYLTLSREFYIFTKEEFEDFIQELKTNKTTNNVSVTETKI